MSDSSAFAFSHPSTGETIMVEEMDQDLQVWQHWEINEEGWYVPSIDELEAMYFQLHKNGVGNFKNEIYWSASEFGDTVAWYYNFGGGMDGTALKKFSSRVRRIKKI